MANKPKDIDEYIASFPAATQKLLEQMRAAIQKTAPEAVEAISYAIPTFKLNGKNLVHFAGFEKHIGLYATPTGHEAFVEDLSKYKQGKGSVQFPINEPLPLSLVERIVKYRVQEMDKKYHIET